MQVNYEVDDTQKPSMDLCSTPRDTPRSRGFSPRGERGSAMAPSMTQANNSSTGKCWYEMGAPTKADVGELQQPWSFHRDVSCNTPRSRDDTSRSCQGPFSASGCPDAAWARLRTPSPEYRYSACAAPPPPLPLAPTGAFVPALLLAQRSKPPEARCLRGTAPPVQTAGVRRPVVDMPEAPVPDDPASCTNPAPPQGISLGEDFACSKGSLGHPDRCGAACKYARKRNGCKDGANCDHCHLCTWRPSHQRFKLQRAAARRTAKGEASSGDSAAGGAQAVAQAVA